MGNPNAENANRIEQYKAQFKANLEKLYKFYEERGYYDEALTWFRRYAKVSNMSSVDKKNTEQELKDSVQAISDELVEFYRKNNLVDLSAQTELTIKALAGYETQINNYRLSEQMLGKNNAEANDTRKKRQLLERKFRELRGQFDSSYVPTDKSMFVNSDWASEKLLYQEKRAADLKRFTTLLELVSTEKMNSEAENLKNQPVIQIVQDAYLPDWKTRPKRATWAIGGFVASFVITLFFVIYQGIRTGSISNSEDVQRKLQQLKAAMHK